MLSICVHSMAFSLDKNDPSPFIDRARECIRVRDFTCAQSALKHAWSLSRSQSQKDSVTDALASLEVERLNVLDDEAHEATAGQRAELDAISSQNRKNVEEGERFAREQRRRDERAATAARKLQTGRESANASNPFAEQATRFAADSNRISQIHNQAMAGIQAQQVQRQRFEQQAREHQQEMQRQQHQRAESDRRATQLTDAQHQRREQDEARAREQRELERRANQLQREQERVRSDAATTHTNQHTGPRSEQPAASAPKTYSCNATEVKVVDVVSTHKDTEDGWSSSTDSLACAKAHRRATMFSDNLSKPGFMKREPRTLVAIETCLLKNGAGDRRFATVTVRYVYPSPDPCNAPPSGISR